MLQPTNCAPEATLRPLVSLPVLAGQDASPGPDWLGYAPLGPLQGAQAPPEPDVPQGQYAPNAVPGEGPSLVSAGAGRPIELLAPAGGPDAAFAALQYGADAIYLGLKKFSARAEAENFTLEELAAVVAHAHALVPRRRVFVTINTLVRNDEVDELVETLAALDELAVDALIIQDLGVYHVARRHFPRLALHASTQLAIHNGAGAAALARLGFARVVLARELTLEEIADTTGSAGVETEVFIHGALCYSYSGLCLFSSQTLGRSGNRGKCAYSCRDSYEVEGAPLTLRDGTPVARDPRAGFPFSMKDLALPDHLHALRGAGVSCLKIEGRKKGPLYVATTTDYYRRLLDGKLAEDQRADREAELQTVFSRPWTRLFVDSHKDKEVADRDTVGHRGAPIGTVEQIRGGRRHGRLRFRTARALEKHDGLQIDLPTLGKPFGFPVDQLWHVGPRSGRPVFQAPRGALVEVGLPADHPELPLGAPIYCSSSQAVKRQYPVGRLRSGLPQTRKEIDVELTLTERQITAVGRLAGAEQAGDARCSLPGVFPEARHCGAVRGAAQGAFAKLGDSGFALRRLVLHNPAGLFVPVSRLNQLRRDLAAALARQLAERQRARLEEVRRAVAPGSGSSGDKGPRPVRWNIKVDRVGFLDQFESEDWAGVDEVVIDIARDHPALLAGRLAELSRLIGREHIRLALPAVTRKWEERGLLHKVDGLRADGWARWEAANLSAWSYLKLDPAAGSTGEIDLATDWSVYVLNRLAARQLLDMGVSRLVLSPEDGLANIRPLVKEFGARAVLVVYQDTPLFLAESCAYANLIGGCPGKARCTFESMEMVSSHGERVTALDYHCRTIVLNQGPFCLSERLADLARAGAVSLRADFIYRRYEPEVVRRRWRAVRAGQPIPGGHAANFDRGVL